jgi:hypothetical protein
MKGTRDAEAAQKPKLPARGPITVQIYEAGNDEAENRHKREIEAELELRRVSQPKLPIRYVTPDELERMSRFPR